MTHICASLKKHVADNTMKLEDKFKEQPQLPVSERFAEILLAVLTHTGRRRGLLCEGEWETGFEKLLQFIRGPTLEILQRRENRVADAMGYRHFLAAIPVARLLEEIIFTPPLTQPQSA